MAENANFDFESTQERSFRRAKTKCYGVSSDRTDLQRSLVFIYLFIYLFIVDEQHPSILVHDQLKTNEIRCTAENTVRQLQISLLQEIVIILRKKNKHTHTHTRTHTHTHTHTHTQTYVYRTRSISSFVTERKLTKVKSINSQFNVSKDLNRRTRKKNIDKLNEIQ